VPFDEGYKFDDYGPGKVLDLSILAFLRDEPVQIFFPNTPSEHETGAKRGCVVLSTADLAPLVAPSEFLRAADWRDWVLIQSQTELSQAVAERAAREARVIELEVTLAAERAAGEARVTELEATLAAERAAGETRVTEPEATLAAERTGNQIKVADLEMMLRSERDKNVNDKVRLTSELHGLRRQAAEHLPHA